MDPDEIVGFPEPPNETPTGVGPASPTLLFDLGDRLQQVRRLEIARLIDIAGSLLKRFGPDIAVGYLYYEILGRPPDGAECARHEALLRRSPAAAPDLAEQLLAHPNVLIHKNDATDNGSAM
jgi:hypothetical protein